MTYLDSLAYLKLNKWRKFIYKLQCFFLAIPGWFVDKFKKLGRAFKKFGLKVADNFVDLWKTFKNGSWSTRVSFLVMGFGSFVRKQWLRGLVFLLLESVFIVYMVLAGAYWLSLFGTLGTNATYTAMEPNEITGELVEVQHLGDNSFKILLYGLLTIFFIIALVYTWRLNVKQNRINDEIVAPEKRRSICKKIASLNEQIEALRGEQANSCGEEPSNLNTSIEVLNKKISAYEKKLVRLDEVSTSISAKRRNLDYKISCLKEKIEKLREEQVDADGEKSKKPDAKISKLNARLNTFSKKLDELPEWNDDAIELEDSVKSTKDDLRAIVDKDFHKTLLSLPVAGITMFTVLPIIFMILVAFTNYDKNHNGYTNLFTWVGLDNFNSVVSFGSKMQIAFGEILAWTLIWAFFATFSCYFLGMLVAIMINKKGIKIKKFWRTIMVMTIAVPQFISLLYISNLFAENGIVNAALMNLGWISSPIKFWGDGTLAKVMVIIINIWVGIPYLMLITTGILMNIPQDLYESARIDGANAFQQFCKITLPYMLFVTGPYLLTSFVGNINNFNVIYLLTQGGPSNPIWGDVGGYVAGDTTILITWLFGITTGNEANYKMASVIGILIFIVVSVLSLVVFTIMPANKREDDFS